jgi:phosphate uptake regulator
MWSELLNILRGTKGDTMEVLGQRFMEMLSTAQQMHSLVYPHVFDHSITLDKRAKIYELDIKVNKAERAIRKQIVAHLSLASPRQDLPHCLIVLLLTKDVERIGDFIKNIAEVSELGGSVVAEGPLRTELERLTRIAVELFEATPAVISQDDPERALDLLHRGRGAAKRADMLIKEIAKTEMPSAQTTSLVLLTRFYKRINAHLVNLLSSVVMPIHKIDFYDEDDLPADLAGTIAADDNADDA